MDSNDPTEVTPVCACVRCSLKASRDKERQKILQMAADNRKIAQRIESRQATVNSNRGGAMAPAAGSRATASRQQPAPRRPPAERPAWRDD